MCWSTLLLGLQKRGFELTTTHTGSGVDVSPTTRTNVAVANRHLGMFATLQILSRLVPFLGP